MAVNQLSMNRPVLLHLPVDVTDAILDLCPVYDVYSYGISSKENYSAYKRYMDHRMKRLIGPFFAFSDMGTFWRQMENSQSMIVGDSARGFCYPTASFSWLEIAVARHNMLGWFKYLALKDWAPSSTFPLTPVPPQNSIPDSAYIVSERTSDVSESDPYDVNDDSEPTQGAFPGIDQTHWFVKGVRLYELFSNTG